MRKSGRNPKPCLRERCIAPNGVGKVCKPSVLPCPMYKLPLAPSQLPTFHSTFKQILILPSRVNWRERLVYEGLQDCSRCKTLFHIKLLTNSAFTFSVHLLIIWEKSTKIHDVDLFFCCIDALFNVVFTFQFWTIFLTIVPVVFDLVRLSAAPHVTRWTSYLSCLHRIILCLMI